MKVFLGISTKLQSSFLFIVGKEIDLNFKVRARSGNGKEKQSGFFLIFFKED